MTAKEKLIERLKKFDTQEEAVSQILFNIYPDEMNEIVDLIEELSKKNSSDKKTVTMKLDSIKDSDAWYEMINDLLWNRFKEENPELDEEELSNKFYREKVKEWFRFGEFGSLEVVINEDMNIVGGRVVPCK